MKRIIGTWLALSVWACAANLNFKETSKEVTAKTDASEVNTEFAFTNSSKKPVTIVQSDPGCPCVKVQIAGGKLNYAPGESGVIRATVDVTNLSGTVDKPIGIWLDKDPKEKPSVVINLRVHIPTLVELEPKTLTWMVGSKPEPQVVTVKMAEGQSIQVVGATIQATGGKTKSESFSATVKTLEKGRLYEVTVTPRDTATPGIGTIRVETDLASGKHKFEQGFAVVRNRTATEKEAGKP